MPDDHNTRAYCQILSCCVGSAVQDILICTVNALYERAHASQPHILGMWLNPGMLCRLRCPKNLHMHSQRIV